MFEVFFLLLLQLKSVPLLLQKDEMKQDKKQKKKYEQII